MDWNKVKLQAFVDPDGARWTTSELSDDDDCDWEEGESFVAESIVREGDTIIATDMTDEGEVEVYLFPFSGCSWVLVSKKSL